MVQLNPEYDYLAEQLVAAVNDWRDDDVVRIARLVHDDLRETNDASLETLSSPNPNVEQWRWHLLRAEYQYLGVLREEHEAERPRGSGWVVAIAYSAGAWLNFFVGEGEPDNFTALVMAVSIVLAAVWLIAEARWNIRKGGLFSRQIRIAQAFEQRQRRRGGSGGRT